MACLHFSWVAHYHWCSFLECVFSRRLLHRYLKFSGSHAVFVIQFWVLFTVWSVYYCSIENLFPAILFWNLAPEMCPKIIISFYKHVFISLNILYLDLCSKHQYAAFNWCMWICTHVSVWEGVTILKQCSYAILSWRKEALCHKLIFPNLNVSYLAGFYLYCGQHCSHFFEELK